MNVHMLSFTSHASPFRLQIYKPRGCNVQSAAVSYLPPRTTPQTQTQRRSYCQIYELPGASPQDHHTSVMSKRNGFDGHPMPSVPSPCQHNEVLCHKKGALLILFYKHLNYLMLSNELCLIVCMCCGYACVCVFFIYSPWHHVVTNGPLSVGIRCCVMPHRL